MTRLAGADDRRLEEEASAGGLLAMARAAASICQVAATVIVRAGALEADPWRIVASFGQNRFGGQNGFGDATQAAAAFAEAARLALAAPAKSSGAVIVPQAAAVAGQAFCAGIRVIGGAGRIVGAIWLLDQRPRRLTRRQRATLGDLAQMTSQLLAHLSCPQESEYAHDHSQMLLQSITGQAMMLLDQAGIVQSWSPGAQQVTGWTQNAAVGRHYGMFLPEPDRPQGAVDQRLRACAELGRLQEEALWQRVDGSLYDAHVELFTLYDPAKCGKTTHDKSGDTMGTVRGFAMVVTDVTEERQAEQALRRNMAELRSANLRLQQTAATLRESNRLLKLAGEMAHLGYWSLDVASGVCTWSEEMFRIHGLKPARQIRLDQAVAAFHPDDRAVVAAALEQASGSGVPFSFEARLVRPEGQVRQVASIGQAERSADGAVIGVVGILLDVTEHRNTQQALRDRDRDMRHVLDNTPALIAYWDSNAINRFGNTAYVEWFGLHPDDMRGRPLRDIVGEAEFEHRRPYVEAALAGRPQSFESEVVRPDGTSGHIAYRFVPDIQDGKVTGFFALGTDITDRKRFETALAESEHRLALEKERAERANSAKSDFLTTMSHEIRTPMNGIIGMNGLLLGTSLDDLQRTYAEAVRISAVELMQIIDDLLDMSRLESGRIEIEAVDFGFDDLVTPAAALFGPLARQKGFELTTFVAPAARQLFRGDPIRLRQVLLNLLSNAVKFTDAGCVSLSVTGEPVSLEASTPGAANQEGDTGNVAIRIEVSDTGIGISSQAQERLFKKFEQADGSISRRFGGSGLGLHICKHLMDLMGGTLTCESTPGQGSRFTATVILPLAEGATRNADQQTTPDQTTRGQSGGDITRTAHQPAALPLRPRETAPPRVAGARVLLADDNEINRLLITTLLEQADYQVQAVVDGAEAIEAARGGGFALVLMDIQMPHVDGLQATEAIRGFPGPESATPIIALTANAMASHRAAYLKAGMNDYLSKPIDPERMLRTVAVWADVGLTRAQALDTPAGGAGPPPTLDADRLGTLRAMLPQDQFRSVVATYLDRKLPFGNAAEATSLDLPGTARLAHELKGSSASLGAARLQHAAARLEAACLAGDRAAVALVITDLSEAEHETKSAIRAWLHAEVRQ